MGLGFQYDCVESSGEGKSLCCLQHLRLEAFKYSPDASALGQGLITVAQSSPIAWRTLTIKEQGVVFQWLIYLYCLS